MSESGGSVKLESLTSTSRGVEEFPPEYNDITSPDNDITDTSPDRTSNTDKHATASSRSPSPVQQSYNTSSLPYIRFRSPVKLGRKILGNIVAVVILAISATYTITAIVYYSSPPDPINHGLANAIKEIVCFLLAVMLVLSRFVKYRECGVCRRIPVNRETVSLILAVLGAVVHFYVLIRWYVQEGKVYVGFSDQGLEYTLEWDVKLIMSGVLVGFILNFVEFSLMLLTKMGPKYRDLNPHLTAVIENEKLLPDNSEALA